MDENEFWRLIELTRASSHGDLTLQYNKLIESLAGYEPKQIIEFEVIFERLIRDADDYKVMAAQKIIEGSVTDDTFLYFCCWLIAQGKEVFSMTLKNPDALAPVVGKDVSTSFEELLYVSTEAYRKRTGIQEENDDFPRAKATELGLNYDFNPGSTKGKEWKVDDLPQLYPKLWAKFQ